MIPEAIKHKSLRELNSFGIDVSTDLFIELTSEKMLQNMILDGILKQNKVFILGGGSNTLFRHNFEGIVVQPVMKEIKAEKESDGMISIECDAGIDWDDFVNYCVENNYGGIENLSYIPGSVGASPIQNIGAYGVEIDRYITNVRAVDLNSGSVRNFTNRECEFGYRSSIFKNRFKGEYLITKVTFSLTIDPILFNTSYGVVNERLENCGEVTLRNIRNVIIGIRKEKLPEPRNIGNAGSFFKNPVVDISIYEKICTEYKEVPSYKVDEKLTKIPAGWLIEKCGWKGFRRGDAGVHSEQALVIVNYGRATGQEIFKLSEEIIASVESRFNITLEREVIVI